MFWKRWIYNNRKVFENEEISIQLLITREMYHKNNNYTSSDNFGKRSCSKRDYSTDIMCLNNT